MLPEPQVPIAVVEMQEYLMSATATNLVTGALVDPSRLLTHLRGNLRIHRFTVMGWLMQNGVTIPEALLDDRLHPEVGHQTPDESVLPGEEGG